MTEIDFEAGAMEVKQRLGGFRLYTNFNWTGQILLGDAGVRYTKDLLALCPSIQDGAIGLLLDATTGELISALVNHGNGTFQRPGPDHRLMVIGAAPMCFTPPALEAIARTLLGGDDILHLREVQSANARQYVSRLNTMGIGNAPALTP